MYFSAKRFKWMLNLYPPFIGAGIKVQFISEDWKTLIVAMKLRWYNRNAVGSHFGGSLYSMIDPHLMLMLMQLLGKKYIVWDKSANIEYLRAAKSEVNAKIVLKEEDLEVIRAQTQNGDKYLPTFEIMITDGNGKPIALVKKTLYVRLKLST